MVPDFSIPPRVRESVRAEDGTPWSRTAREAIIQWLRFVLTNRRAYQGHLRFLRGGNCQLGHLPAALLLDFADFLPLPDEVVYEIEENGFVNISNEVLRELLVNPIALQDLARLVEDAPEGYWAEVAAESNALQPDEPSSVTLPEEDFDEIPEDSELALLLKQRQRVCEKHYTRVQLRRRVLELAGIIGLFALPLEKYEAVVEELGRCTDRLLQLEGNEFLREDIRFHLLLARYAPPDIRRTLRQLIRLILEHGGASIVNAEARQAVHEEHRRIVDELRNRNEPAARQRLGEHLHQARERWSPGSQQRILTANAAYFDAMGTGHALFFLSLDVAPIEFGEVFYQERVAEAVRRGADLVYLRPGKRLLKEYRRANVVIDPLLTTSDLRSEFHRFRRRIAELLAGVPAGHEVPEAIGNQVDQQVVLLELRREIPFLQAGRTVGYFLCPDSPEGRFTERDLLNERDTWPEIVESESVSGRHFRFVLTRVLSDLGSRKRAAGHQHRHAKRLAEKWFPPLAQPPVIV